MRRARLTSLHMVVRNKSDQKADKENGVVFSSSLHVMKTGKGKESRQNASQVR